MEQGWDPEIKKYFKKILYSICFGLFWLMSFVAIGLYAGLAYPSRYPVIAVLVFYAIMLATFFLLMRYYYRSWKK